MIVINRLQPKWILCGITLICLSALSVAYIGEYFFNLKPCILCLYQRYLFIATAVSAFLGYFWDLRVQLFSILGTGVLFLGNFGVALYQALVEKHLVPLPSICKATQLTTGSFEDFKKGLQTLSHVPCDQIPVEFLGISMAGYNALVTFALAVGCLWIGVSLTKNFRNSDDA